MGHEAETWCQNQTKEIQESFSPSRGILLQKIWNSALNTNLDHHVTWGEVIHPWQWLPTTALDQGFKHGSLGEFFSFLGKPWKTAPQLNNVATAEGIQELLNLPSSPVMFLW